jgi:type IV pilus assembly protein PilW
MAAGLGELEGQLMMEKTTGTKVRAMAGEPGKISGLSGYTLVEVMVAMLIIFIVMGGVYRTISDETINMDRQEKILDMQNNARAVIERLTRDLRRTGFMGCGGVLSANTLPNEGSNATWVEQYTLADTAIGGQDWDGSLSMLDEIRDNGVNVDYLGENLAVLNDAPAGHGLYKEGSDALTLVYLSNQRNLANAIDPLDADVVLDLNEGGYATGDIIYMTDCANFALFQKTNGDNALTIEHDDSSSTYNTSKDLGKIYGVTAPTKLFKLNVVPYFIEADANQLSRGTKGEDIASNIEDLQVEFLFDTNDDGVLSDENWQDGLGTHSSKEIRAVRVWVLAMSDPDYGYTDNNTYDYPNSPYYTPSPNTTYRNEKGLVKPGNPFASANGGGGSPAAQAPLAGDGEHRFRYLASSVIYLRNAGLKVD